MPDEPGHTAVIALGGNAHPPSGAHSTITDQLRHTRERLAPVVDLALDGWRLRVVHGAGLPVGDAPRRTDAAEPVARAAGWIGDMTRPSLDGARRRAERMAPKVRAARHTTLGVPWPVRAPRRSADDTQRVRRLK
jgi:carbamate kinase